MLRFSEMPSRLCLKNSEECIQGDTKASKSSGPSPETTLKKFLVYSGRPEISKVFRNSYLSAEIKTNIEQL